MAVISVPQGTELKISIKVEDLTDATLHDTDVECKAQFYISGKKAKKEIYFDKAAVADSGADGTEDKPFGMKEVDSDDNTYIVVVPTDELSSGQLMGEVIVTYPDDDADDPVNDSKITEVYSINPGVNITVLS